MLVAIHSIAINVLLPGIHYSWETSMAGRIARLIRCSEDADNAAIEPSAERGKSSRDHRDTLPKLT